jgi:hypothetical protein
MDPKVARKEPDGRMNLEKKSLVTARLIMVNHRRRTQTPNNLS